MSTVRQVEITKSEIELIKCISSSDYARWLKIHSNETDNPFVSTAKEKYDDAYFNEHKSLSGYKKYLKKFPNGVHSSEAKAEIIDLKKLREVRIQKNRVVIENIGCIINIAIFLFVFLTPLIAGDWNIGESFLIAFSMAPLYYGIYSITKRRDKD